MENFKTNQKGITLIALIITIIVMLILVGVTINVALNGGLFEKGEKAAFQTEASTVKEQLEMAKALKVMDADGKPVDDYSDITVGNLEGLDDETKTKYANILVVAKNGDICYNPASVTDKEKTWLEEIGIKAYVNTGGSEPTIAYGEKYILTGNSDVYLIFLEDGTTGGTATSGMTVTYRLNGTTLQASIDGAEYMDFGFFNEDFSRFETIENDVSDGGQVFELEGQNSEPNEPDLANTVYRGTLKIGEVNYEINIKFNENGSLNYSVPQLNHTITYDYEFKETGNITVNDEVQNYSNVIFTNYVTENGSDKELYGYFNEDFTIINIIHSHTWHDNALTEILWCECTLTQE